MQSLCNSNKLISWVTESQQISQDKSDVQLLRHYEYTPSAASDRQVYVVQQIPAS